jgi:hypothetical protein
MTRKTIPIEEAAKVWMKAPEFRAGYYALEGELALAAGLKPIQEAFSKLSRPGGLPADKAFFDDLSGDD